MYTITCTAVTRTPQSSLLRMYMYIHCIPFFADIPGAQEKVLKRRFETRSIYYRLYCRVSLADDSSVSIVSSTTQVDVDHSEHMWKCVTCVYILMYRCVLCVIHVHVCLANTCTCMYTCTLLEVMDLGGAIPAQALQVPVVCVFPLCSDLWFTVQMAMTTMQQNVHKLNVCTSSLCVYIHVLHVCTCIM